VAWRTIDTDGEVWHVQAAAERRAETTMWQLSLAFRASGSDPGERPIWARYPLEAVSKSSLFQAADRLTDEAIKDLLVQKIG